MISQLIEFCDSIGVTLSTNLTVFVRDFEVRHLLFLEQDLFASFKSAATAKGLRVRCELGRVDKLNPDSDAGKQHEGGEALDQLVVAGGDTA
jgi:hypothetical protein